MHTFANDFFDNGHFNHVGCYFNGVLCLGKLFNIVQFVCLFIAVMLYVYIWMSCQTLAQICSLQMSPHPPVPSVDRLLY